MPVSSLRLLAVAAAVSAASASLTLSFDANVALNKVARPYLAFNIDTGSLFNGLNFSDPKLRMLTAQLGPSFIRIGGTAVDYSYYEPSLPYVPGTINGNNKTGNTFFSDDMLAQVVDFFQSTNMTLLWDFNGLSFRTGTGPWDPTANATGILSFLNSTYGAAIDRFAYSVGNEPDLWPGAKVSPKQLALDSRSLKRALASFDVGQDVYGPSYAFLNATAAAEYLAVAKGSITGFTAHCYPVGHPCDPARYADKSRVATGLREGLQGVVQAAASVGYEGLLVLEETAGSAGGGCENITDRFVSGFTWMAIMSTTGASGFHRVHRQDIVGWSFAFGMSHYQLTGPPGWTNGSAASLSPHPDWFTSVLWKTLVGGAVLNTTVQGDAADANNTDLRFWCAEGDSSASSLVLPWINTGASDVSLSLPPSLLTQPYQLYALTSTAQGWREYAKRMERGAPGTGDIPASLQNDEIYLNGALLSVDAESGALPPNPFPPAVLPPSTPVTLPPYAYGFLVFKADSAIPACA